MKKLFWLQFFQGAGISFFFTAVFARFLDKFPIVELPWVMVYSAFLLWFTGFIYSILEHSVKFARFNRGIILFMSFSMLLVWAGARTIPNDWFYYFSLAWFYSLYLLNNLEFWGIAARLFDMRQSKRLFGLISSGDIPAKFIGYTIASVLVPFTGTSNLMLLGVICMLVSIPLFNSISKIEKLLEASHHHGPAHHHPHTGSKLQSLINNFTASPVIRKIALISLIASACILLVNYGLYVEVKGIFHNDVELARFIALFMAALRLVALITKTIFTGRLTTKLGVMQSLFITPIVMAILVVLIVLLYWIIPEDKLIFYLFGATSIAVDVLRASINSPVLLTVMQPLPTHERLRAHNVVKGIMDPFATLFCGILLITMYKVQEKVDLIALCYVLLGLAIFWIIGIVRLNKAYLQMLVNTISSRFFSQEEFSLNDHATLDLIKQKIRTGNESEVFSILRMVASKQNPLSAELLSDFLQHDSDQVVLETIRLIRNNNIQSMKDTLETMLLRSENPDIKSESIKAICKLSSNIQELEGYLQQPDNRLRLAALTGALCNSHPTIRANAEEKVRQYIHSSDLESKQIALGILEEVRDEYAHPDHIALMQDPEPAVRLKAVRTIGKATATGTIATMFDQPGQLNKHALNALQQSGESSIPAISGYLLNGWPDSDLQNKLINICGNIGGSKSQDLLLSLIAQKPQLAPYAVKALYRSKYVADDASRPLLEDTLRAYLKYGVELLFMQRAIKIKNGEDSLVYRSIAIELKEIQDTLLSLMGCLYDREQIRKIRNSLRAHNKESIANAMEIIEVTAKKDFGRVFNTLYEVSDIDHRCDTLKSLMTEKQYHEMEQVITRILSERPISYLDWTKACSIYVSKKAGYNIDRSFYEKYLKAENILLKETASFAIEN
ncbi:hypothetical protein KJS94_08730 [Flavihumibacter rivuli]|uniref:hypothetical protein n=1 Tax=Flavihumibacter rivuli TaxID=2838156 RepID=UPI001BDEC3CD|nr:hypothetical protein [Flavihumibacter rivuli]ULQ58278.1 hypothetical protein KJS94_08730 [Flavihumibacter rivuli]